jgi:IQ and AAA domain-containing protein
MNWELRIEKIGLPRSFSNTSLFSTSSISRFINKLEECYDQIVQPQKKATIKPVLEAVMSRIALIKKDLVDFNPRRGSIYVHLDQLLFDLKYDPSVIEIPVPRYFKEDDRIPVDIKFLEKPDKKEKKKKKKGKKKKKKKADDEEEEKKPPPPSLIEKRQLLDSLLNEYVGTDEPEKEIVHDPFTLDMDIVQAIRIIQKNDRGRQYRDRIIKIVETWRDSKDAPGVGGINPHAEELSIEEACIRLQRIFKGIIDRKRIEQIRNEELAFLGMAPKTKDSTDKSQDPIKKAAETRKARKALQEEKMKDYISAKEDMKQDIIDNQGHDIKEDMLKQRRDWITEEIRKKGGAIPTSLEDFHNRMNVEAPLTPEEEELKKLMEEEEAKKKKKGKKGGDKPKKGNKKKKKDEDDGKDNVKMVGPPEEVQKFSEFQDRFNNDWATKDETDNFDQDFDTEMVKEEVMPDIQKEFKTAVDAVIMMELENIKINQSGYKEKKKKKKKGKKKGKKKKKAKDPEWLTWPKKIPGLKAIKKYSRVEDLLAELVQMGIAKKFPEERLDNFRGDFNYLHSFLDDLNVGPYDPSMALIRQIVTETCILPLGSQLVKDRSQFIKSVLFYGPPGTGKTLVARAIVHETASMVFDLSPLSIQGKYSEKKGEEKMVASVFAVARHFQPSVVYIDE